TYITMLQLLTQVDIKEVFWFCYLYILLPNILLYIFGFRQRMSVRELFPFFKWGFNIRRSSFLVPILNNNIIVTGEEAVACGIDKHLPEPEHQDDRRITGINQCATEFLASTAEIQQAMEKEKLLQEQIESSKTPTPTPTSPTTVSRSSIASLSDEEIIVKVEKGEVALYRLEAELNDCERAVQIRRAVLTKNIDKSIEDIPHLSYDFSKVLGACCENVIGYVPIPVGTAGPISLNDKSVLIPMATTEGCLVASTHRGCRAISESGGARATILSRGMTRAPVVRFPSITEVSAFVEWIKINENYESVKKEFDATSRFAKLIGIKTSVAGRLVYIRFRCDTGDAMGMNMVSKGVDSVLKMMKNLFADMEIISISGNMCTDKKPSAINWIEGRGRSVVCEATIRGDIVKNVLKTSVQAMVELNLSKNLVGSAMSGSIGGFNAHASNIVTAIFLATGQDCAQNVESSNCITLMEECNEGNDLYITVTMPSIEVGTVGGGTFLPAQSSCLDIIGVKGSKPGSPGVHADQLARIVCAGVMAGELSLLAALSAGHLMKSHLRLNRSLSSTNCAT
ncbi:hypothetical protein SAMD00019534_009090, partial [Acytostelium subglobosum LB1]|uniref:hypothetical protein n=1 Tax=Acytostelium subglobosum LB1 TaxID=1410327 RepID=UPI000644AE90